MTEGGSIEIRLAAIEERLGMEAGLRDSLDRDLSGIVQRQAAANHLIRALAIIQSQHTEELATHTELLRSAHTKLDLLVTMLGRHTGPEDDETRSLANVRCRTLPLPAGPGVVATGRPAWRSRTAASHTFGRA